MRAEWVPDVLSGYLRTTVPLGTDDLAVPPAPELLRIMDDQAPDDL